MNRQLICAALSGGAAAIICQAVLTLLLRKYRRYRAFAERSAVSQEVLHHGSCHCARVSFEVMTQQKLRTMTKTSERTFNGIQVKIWSFKLTSDQSVIFTYSSGSDSDSGGNTTGSLAFCSFCGMHVLYSSISDPDWLEVNIDCFQIMKHCRNVGLLNINKASTGGEISQDGEREEMIFSPNIFSEGSHTNTYTKFYETIFSAELSSNMPRQLPDRMRCIDSGLKIVQYPFSCEVQGSPDGEISRFLNEIEWTQMYSGIEGLNKNRFSDPNGSHGEFSSSECRESDVELVGLTRKYGSGSFCSCESGGNSLQTSSGSFSTAPSDDGTAASIFFDDEDSISVLTSRITSEGDTDSPTNISVCSRRESAQVVNYALNSTGNDMGSVAMESPYRMCQQLRVHLSRHLN